MLHGIRSRNPTLIKHLLKSCQIMMTSSNGNIFCVAGHFVRGIHRSPVNNLHKGQWRGALMFSLICVWINGWVNNPEAGDLRHYRSHYDVTVIYCHLTVMFALFPHDCHIQEKKSIGYRPRPKLLLAKISSGIWLWKHAKFLPLICQKFHYDASVDLKGNSEKGTRGPFF